MPLTKVNRGGLNTGISDSSDATSITIDSSENVGVGTTTMNRQVVLNNNSLACLQLTNSTTGVAAGAGSQFQQSGNNGYIGNYSGSFTLFTGASGTAAQVIDANGHVTMPKQSSFLASFGNANTNIALNSAVHQYFDTEVYDINGDYASNTFTAPVTGKYLLQVRLRVDNLPTDPAYIWFYIQTSNRVHTVDFFDPDNFDGGGVYYTVQGTIIADMDASDTATFNIHQSGGSQVTDLDSGFFSGHLLG